MSHEEKPDKPQEEEDFVFTEFPENTEQSTQALEDAETKLLRLKDFAKDFKTLLDKTGKIEEVKAAVVEYNKIQKYFWEKYPK